MRDSAVAALLAAGFQTQPPETVVVVDTGARPRTADYEFRMALDILTERGQRVLYARRQGDGVTAARLLLGELAAAPRLLWVDDDTVLEPDVAAVLGSFLDRNPDEAAAAAQAPTPNNEWQDPQWCPPHAAPPPYRYAPAATEPERATPGLTGVLMRRSAWATMKSVLVQHHEEPGQHPHEDLAVWHALGQPFIVPAATAWEMKHPGGRVFPPYPDALA